MATTIRSSWYEWRDAIAGRDFATAATFIQMDPELIQKTNGIGETVLHFLAVENDAMGVAWLDEQGADINCENDFGIPVRSGAVGLPRITNVVCAGRGKSECDGSRGTGDFDVSGSDGGA